MMLTLLAFQLAFPAGYALAKGLHAQGRVSARRLETLVDRNNEYFLDVNLLERIQLIVLFMFVAEMVLKIVGFGEAPQVGLCVGRGV